MAEGAYPIIVRETAGLRLYTVALFVLAAAMLGFVAGVPIFFGKTDDRVGDVFAAIFALASLASLAAAYHTAIWRLVLEKDSIASSGIFGRRTLPRSQIAGIRSILNGRRCRLVPSDRTHKPLTFSAALFKNEALLDWLEGIPDLDAAEYHAALAAYEQDSRYGATVEERQARLAWMERIVSAVDWPIFGLGLAVVVVGQSYPLLFAVLAAFPPLAIALNFWSRGLLRFGLERANDPRPTLGALFFMPGMALGVSAGIGTNLLDWRPALADTAVLALSVMALLLWRSRHPVRWDQVFLMAVLVAAYCFGVLALADVTLDTASPQRFPARVLGKHFETGRSNTRYYLTVDPWGPMTKSGDVRVSESVYRAENSGDTVCVFVGPGQLGWRWYGVGKC
ncbi:MAG TPA: hypothetical protein VMH86_11640 [Rhizomicrobium sp.]|nr:hypothetical protein [Rhizomicrobium sp.]